MTPAIEIRGLRKAYGRTQALDGLDMTVPRKTVYGFLGVNGAGKTTTLGIASGFLMRDGGRCSVNGSLSSLPQDAKLFSGRSVVSQLVFLARLSGTSGKRAKSEAERVLKLVGLGERPRSAPEKLSHGMRKRVSFAQALLGDPEIILLDEPTAGLDPQNASEIKKLIVSLGREKTVVVSSHVLAEIEEMCTEVGVIHEGRMRFEGPVSELTRTRSRVNYRLSGRAEPPAVREFPGVQAADFDAAEATLTVVFDPAAISVEELNRRVFALLGREKIGVREILLGRSLEEGFLDLLK
jgi:ABC-type multidrug transport system ATPase subunit